MHKLKVLLVGPPECGKTTLSNFLSDAAEVGSGDYRPTKGCRIVEFETNVPVNDHPIKVEVELWDVGGDLRYNHCWPAIQRSTNGVVFVYNPGNEEHPRNLEHLYSQFAGQQGLKDSQCIVFCHHKPDSTGNSAKLPSTFSGIPQVDSQLSEEGNSRLHQDFTRFLGQVIAHMSDLAEKNESALLL